MKSKGQKRVNLRGQQHIGIICLFKWFVDMCNDTCINEYIISNYFP